MLLHRRHPAHLLPNHPESDLEPGASSFRRYDQGNGGVRGGRRRVSGNGGRRLAPRPRNSPREDSGLREEEEEQDNAMAAEVLSKKSSVREKDQELRGFYQELVQHQPHKEKDE